jgi:nitroreductase
MLDNKRNDILKFIHQRSSIRDFTGDQISGEILLEIVKAGMAAPSANNFQPWSFIIVTEKEAMLKLAENLPYAKMLEKAGGAIVVCGTPDTKNPELSNYWIQDCSAATQNILLAVEAFGLGAVWTGVYPRMDRIKWVKEVLNIPAEIVPLNVIPIGHPAKPSLIKDKFKPDKIHLNKWDENQ